MKWTNEAKVGGLILVTFVIAAFFAFSVGVMSPFQKTLQFYVTYQFAGGIDVGSPVRVAGIKVGRVEKIEFFPLQQQQPAQPAAAASGLGAASLVPDLPYYDETLTPLKLTLSVRTDVSPGIREDSQFFINLAGIIGERYIEITPGHWQSPQVRAGQVLKGIDPPRIDQLISQSFSLAGKIKQLIDENKGDLAHSLELVFKLSGSLNRTLSWIDKSALFKTDLALLIGNLIDLTQDAKKLTHHLQSEELAKTLKLMQKLVGRLEPLDAKALREFLQSEGVKVNLF